MMIMMMMIRKRIIRKKMRIIIRVNIIITTTTKTMRVARMIMRMADKNDNENDQSNESDRSKHNNNNKVKNNQNSKNDNNNYKNENQCNDHRKGLTRMIMRMIKAMRVTGVNIIITIKLKIIRIARMITIIIRIRISAMTIGK